MDKIDFDNVLFHGVSYFLNGTNIFNVSMERLELILKSNALLSRNKQKEQLPSLNLAPAHFDLKTFDNEDWVSVCQKKSFYNENSTSTSYEEFIDYSYGLVLNKKLLDDLEHRERYTSKGHRFHCDDGEYQIKDQIPSKYFLGFFADLPSDIVMLEGLKNSKLPDLAYHASKTENIFKVIMDHGFPSKEVMQATYSGAEVIRNILNETGYNNLPIFSIHDGNPITSAENVIDHYNRGLDMSSNNTESIME